MLPSDTPRVTSGPSHRHSTVARMLYYHGHSVSDTIPSEGGRTLAYQRIILSAQHDFVEEAWVTYDTCYRRQAAAKKSLDWPQVDFNFYNQTFAGKAKVKNRCKHCLSEYHKAADCRYAPDLPSAQSAPVWQGEPPLATTRRPSSDPYPTQQR